MGLNGHPSWTNLGVRNLPRVFTPQCAAETRTHDLSIARIRYALPQHHDATTRKRGNCEFHSHAMLQPFPTLITTPCQVWRRWTDPLPYYSVFAANTLLYAVTLTLNFGPVTMTFDFWPWTYAAYPLLRDQTLYQMRTQSNNPRQSYCDFSVWPYDLEHFFSVALGCGIIFTKFYLRQGIRTWIMAFFDADTLCQAVTLTFYLLTLIFYGTSGVTVVRLNSVHNLSEIE